MVGNKKNMRVKRIVPTYRVKKEEKQIMPIWLYPFELLPYHFIFIREQQSALISKIPRG